MGTVAPNNAWDRLYRAMRQVDPVNPDGAWQLITSGTVNIVGGGAGGTAMTDNNPFTPGGTSITPAGGYVGGRSIASGNAGAIGLSPSGAVLVHVIAGGAGGGLAQLQVVGTDNSNFANVGWPSGGSPTLNAIPVQVMNQTAGGGGGGFATAAVYGSPAFPVYNVGSQYITNGSLPAINLGGSVGALGIGGSMGVTQIGAPWSVTGSQGVTQLGAPWSVTGSMNATNLGGSVGVTQIGAPWSMVGSVGVTPLASFTVNQGSVFTVNMGLGTVNIGNAHGIFGSVSILGSVNLGGQPISVVGSVNATNIGGSVYAYADIRGLTTPTVWQLAYAGSGYLAISIASLNPAVRTKFTGAVIVATGTADITFQSPSGTYLTGSLRLLPGAGFIISPGGHWPWLVGASNATLFIHGTGTQNIGGALPGFIE